MKIETRTSGKEPKQRLRGKDDPLVNLWKYRLGKAESNLREWGGDTKDGGGWKELVQMFEGDTATLWSGIGGRGKDWHRITANLIKSNTDALRPQLFFSNPRVHIQLKNPYVAPEDIPQMTIDPQNATAVPATRQVPDPQTGRMIQVPILKFLKGTPLAKVGGQWVDAERQRELVEALDNYYLDEMDADQKMKRVINDSLILPYGVLKLEWIVSYREVEEDGQKKRVDMRQFPRVSRVKPWRFLWDEDLDEFDLSLARWVAEIKYLAAEDIMNDPLLENLSSLPQPNYNLADEEIEDTSRIPEELLRHKVYEIHDLQHEKLIVWIEGSPKFQRYGDNPYSDVEGSIYTVLGFDETPIRACPLPIPAQVLTKQQAYNWILSALVNHIRRFNRKYAGMKNAMDPDEEAKLAEGADGTYITVKDMSMIPQPISDAPVSPDLYNVKDVMKQEITEEYGVSAMDRARREPGVQTAYEASQIQGGATIKAEEKRSEVGKFVRRVVRKLNQILKIYAKEDEVIQITGAKGKYWQSWSSNDIQGEFIEDVDIYSSQPHNQDLERRQKMELFSLLQNDPYVNPYEVRKMALDVFHLSERLLLTPQEIQQKERDMRQGEMDELLENQKQQARTIRPGQGEIRRGSDVLGGILGPARGGRY